MKSNTNKSYISSYLALFIGFLLSCLIFYEIKNLKIRFIHGKLFFLNEFIKWDWTIFIFLNLITIIFSRSIYNKITYTNKIENLIKKSVEDEKKLRLSTHIIENIPEGVIVTDKYNKIISVNDSFLKTTGYKKRDLIGSNPKILNSNHHNPFFYKEMWNSIKYKGGGGGVKYGTEEKMVKSTLNG
ncbi:PAS domain S-box protein [Psychrilyobacter sp.]|uniref:PAS domain S-box protein n=1 Tax=Psychrilyobacter sp. TaxID=2586924 RepID=UPI00301698B9